MPNLLDVSNLGVEYKIGRSTVLAVDNVNLDFPLGDTLGVVGESGSGKTTLALALLRLIEPPGVIANGRIEFDGRDVLKMEKKELNEYRWRQVSMVYQSAMDSLNPVKPIIQPIYEVLRHQKKTPRREARYTAIKMLSDVGIPPERALDFPHEMSGGMRQRVVIALALALSPRLLIADEPTSALDVVTQRQILALIRKQSIQRGLSLIFITHEISVLNGLVEHIAVMYGGEIVEKGPVWNVLKEPRHPYTEMLVGTLLSMTAELSALDSMAGRRESMGDSLDLPVNACKYANRCKYASDRCRRERPQLTEIEQGRLVACHKYA